MLKSFYLLPILATLSASCDSQLPPGYHICADVNDGSSPSDSGAKAKSFTLPLAKCTVMMARPEPDTGAQPPEISLVPVVPNGIRVDSVESCAKKQGTNAQEIVCTIEKENFALPGFDSSWYRIDVDETHFLPTFLSATNVIIASGNIRIIQPGASEVVITTPVSVVTKALPKGPLTAGSPSYLWQPLHKLTDADLEVRFMLYLICEAPMTTLAFPISWTVRSITLTPIAASCGS